MEILVVDDHPLLRAGLECMLEATPDLHVMGTVGNGAKAVELARRSSPDVVLMDISLPGMDGVEATRRMCELRPAPLVVMLTSTCSATSVRDAFAAGAAGYLVKDLPPERLVAVLRGLRDGLPAIDPRAARVLQRLHQGAGEAAPLRRAEAPAWSVD